MMMAWRERRPPLFDGFMAWAAAAAVVKVTRWGQVAAAALVLHGTGAAAAATALSGSRPFYRCWRRPPLYDGGKAWAGAAVVFTVTRWGQVSAAARVLGGTGAAAARALCGCRTGVLRLPLLLVVSAAAAAVLRVAR